MNGTLRKRDAERNIRKNKKSGRIMISEELGQNPAYLESGHLSGILFRVPMILWGGSDVGCRVGSGHLPELHAIITTTLSWQAFGMVVKTPLKHRIWGPGLKS